MSVGIAIEYKGGPKYRRALDHLSRLDTDDLLDNIGSEIESQFRRRIVDEKTGPDGEPWEDWSFEYGRHQDEHKPNASLLVNEGLFRDSIQYNVEPDQVEIGSNLIQASTLHYGDDRLAFGRYMAHYPARPVFGLSDENHDDIDGLVEDWFREVMGVIK